MTQAYFLNAFGLFLAATVRFSGFFLYTPVFSGNQISARVKAGLSALCALLVLPALLQTHTFPALSAGGYAILVIKELSFGFAIGFVAILAESALRMGGNMIGMQIGFSFVQVADPISGQSLGIVADSFRLLGMLIFLCINGHLIILKAFFDSFLKIPPAGADLNILAIKEIMESTKVLFVSGLQVAMPIIAVTLISDVALGIIARTVPKINIFQLGFAIKILAGLLMIVLFIHILGDASRDLLEILLNKIFEISRLISP